MGYLASRRSANRMSIQENRIWSTTRSPREVLASSRWFSVGPNSRRALRPASAGESPRRTNSAVRISRWCANSSRISDSTSSRRRTPRYTERIRAARPRSVERMADKGTLRSPAVSPGA